VPLTRTPTFANPPVPAIGCEKDGATPTTYGGQL
jgi:hypothetical protein